MANKANIVISYIEENIKNKELKSGDKIPGELALAKILGVSRNTIREGLSILNDKKIITKVNGIGNFISDKEQKYIVIATKAEYLLDLLGSTYSSIIKLLKEQIEKNGFKFHLYLEQNDDTDLIDAINIKPEKIAGIFGVIENIKTLDKLDKYEIPIISCAALISKNFYALCFDHFDLTDKFKYLINKYNFKNPLVISLESKNSTAASDGFAIYYSTPRYLVNFDENKILPIMISSDFKEAPRILKKKIENLDYTPDVLVFTDDVIFSSINDTISNVEILKDIKIITHANKYSKVGINKNVCSVAFDLKEQSIKAMNLMLKLINKDFVLNPNIYMKTTILNEEILKK